LLEDPLTEPWYVKAYNGGPSVAMAVNPEKFDELGLEIPTNWNDLLSDDFEGVETDLPSYIVKTPFG
jgi:ABC-type glycerol-3-phosphate transport system substrate-binding protein